MSGILALPEADALRLLSRDGRLLFGTRVVRMFAYGLLSVVLVLYLVQAGLSDAAIGLILTLTLIGDAVVSLWITTSADRVGRRRMLVVGALLMILAGVVFVSTTNLIVLTLAAIIGTISPSGSEVGPCQPIEQAALPQAVPSNHRTQIFAWYNLVGSLATAGGALIGGTLAQSLQSSGATPLASYQVILVLYGLLGIALALLFGRLSPEVEPDVRRDRESGKNDPRPARGFFGLHRSRGIIFRLSALFIVDSFAGALVLQSLVAYWFHLKFGVPPAVLGAIFFATNLFAAGSALAAARVARRIGLVNTMVFTHLPSNLFLALVPLMPSLPLAIAMLLLRSSISQMDVPTRQSYVMAVVDPDERSAASGVTIIARTFGSAFAPVITGALLGASLLSVPFFLSGGLKIAYDLSLWRSFRAIKPPEEQAMG
jgi:MFS family permease